MTPHTDPHAALIIAELLALVPLDEAPIIEEALDYLAAARREHPEEYGAMMYSRVALTHKSNVLDDGT